MEGTMFSEQRHAIQSVYSPSFLCLALLIDKSSSLMVSFQENSALGWWLFTLLCPGKLRFQMNFLWLLKEIITNWAMRTIKVILRASPSCPFQRLVAPGCLGWGASFQSLRPCSRGSSSPCPFEHLLRTLATGLNPPRYSRMLSSWAPELHLHRPF